MQCVDVDQNRKNNICDIVDLIDMPLFDPASSIIRVALIYEIESAFGGSLPT